MADLCRSSWQAEEHAITEPEKIVHDFLPKRSLDKPKATATRSTSTKSANKARGSKRPKKAAPTKKNKRDVKGRGKTTLLKQIRELDRSIDLMSVQLRREITIYQASPTRGRSSKSKKPPTRLLNKWEAAIRQLNRLLEKASYMGLAVQTKWGGFELPNPQKAKKPASTPKSTKTRGAKSAGATPKTQSRGAGLPGGDPNPGNPRGNNAEK